MVPDGIDLIEKDGRGDSEASVDFIWLNTLLVPVVVGYAPLSVALLPQAPAAAVMLALLDKPAAMLATTVTVLESPDQTLRESTRFPAVKPPKVPEIETLSKRQLPEVLFRAPPDALKQSAPVEAFTN